MGYSNWSTSRSFSTKLEYVFAGPELVKLIGDTTYENFGVSVAINNAGDTVVIGASEANSQTGYVRVYKLITGSWVVQGSQINGEALYEHFGCAVGINASGDTIVVGASGANTNTGYVKVYKLITSVWTIQGVKIIGAAVNEGFGSSVDINTIGDTIIVGAPYANTSSGYAKVYKNIAGTWTLQGSARTGTNTYSYCGYYRYR
jgi:N-dimethylarginine dimethylaminohydrolase